MPVLSSVHIDTALTNVSIQYRNDEYIADQVFMPLPVNKRSDKYFVYAKDKQLRTSGVDAQGQPLSLRRPKTEAASLDFALSTDNYFAEEYAVRELVSDAEVTYADNPLQPEVDATDMLTDRLLLDWENYIATLTCKSGSYPSSNRTTLTTGGSGTSWGSGSYASTASNPFTTIATGKSAILSGIAKQANSMMLTYATAQAVANHPEYLKRIVYTSKETLTNAGVVNNIAGLDIVIGSAQKVTSAEGVAAITTGSCWQDSGGRDCALIYYKGPSAGPRTVHFGRTFSAPDDTTGAQGIVTRKYRWEPLKGNYIETSMTRAAKFIGVDGSGLSLGGYLVLSAII